MRAFTHADSHFVVFEIRVIYNFTTRRINYPRDPLHGGDGIPFRPAASRSPRDTPYIRIYTRRCGCSCNLLGDTGHYFADPAAHVATTTMRPARALRGPYPVEILSLFLPRGPLLWPAWFVRAIVLGECKADDISSPVRVPEY